MPHGSPQRLAQPANKIMGTKTKPTTTAFAIFFITIPLPVIPITIYP